MFTRGLTGLTDPVTNYLLRRSRRSLNAIRISLYVRGLTEYPPLSNAPFVLFIGAVLGYGGMLAWYMLAHFDLVDMLRPRTFGNVDDSFYYFQIARNMADGKFSTFDGVINRTDRKSVV